tara:strand:+ start:1988 stop:3451 length:1464 start_codon:yes stop_codon:yes gene_type:complete
MSFSSGVSGYKSFESPTNKRDRDTEKENAIPSNQIGTTQVNSPPTLPASLSSVIERATPRTPAKKRCRLSDCPELSFKIGFLSVYPELFAQGSEKKVYKASAPGLPNLVALSTKNVGKKYKDSQKYLPVSEGGWFHPYALVGEFLIQNRGSRLFDLNVCSAWSEFTRQVYDIGYMASGLEETGLVAHDLKYANMIDIGRITARIDSPIGFKDNDCLYRSNLMYSRFLVGTPLFESPLLIKSSLDEQVVWSDFLNSFLQLIDSPDKSKIESKLGILRDHRDVSLRKIRLGLLGNLNGVNMFAVGSIVLGGVLSVLNQSLGKELKSFQHWLMDPELKKQCSQELHGVSPYGEDYDRLKCSFQNISQNFLKEFDHALKQSFYCHEINNIYYKYQNQFLSKIDQYKELIEGINFNSVIDTKVVGNLKKIALVSIEAMTGDISPKRFESVMRDIYDSSKGDEVFFNKMPCSNKSEFHSELCSATQLLDDSDT